MGASDSEAVPARQRRERMRVVIGERDFTRVADLSEMFAISEVTVRSDLDALARRGQIRRVRGGAVPRSRSGPERPFEETRTAHADQKQAIGRAAAGLVSHGDTVLLDVGTTAAAVARALVEREDLQDVQVFTNGLNIAMELEPAIPRITVVVTGGTLRPLQHSLVDPLGGTILDQLHASLVFLGCNGVDAEAGVTNLNLPEAEIKRRMLGVAGRRIVIADGSKIGAVTLVQLCDLDDVDLLITSSSADPDVLGVLRERGVEVLVA
jgi:DeoR family transcriptional regulator, aga operon transcriptional repressor